MDLREFGEGILPLITGTVGTPIRRSGRIRRNPMSPEHLSNVPHLPGPLATCSPWWGLLSFQRGEDI